MLIRGDSESWTPWTPELLSLPNSDSPTLSSVREHKRSSLPWRPALSQIWLLNISSLTACWCSCHVIFPFENSSQGWLALLSFLLVVTATKREGKCCQNVIFFSYLKCFWLKKKKANQNSTNHESSKVRKRARLSWKTPVLLGYLSLSQYVDFLTIEFRFLRWHWFAAMRKSLQAKHFIQAINRPEKPEQKEDCRSVGTSNFRLKLQFHFLPLLLELFIINLRRDYTVIKQLFSGING